jgi:hypothetical protein
MDPEEGSSENERFARPGTSRREFLGRTIRGGALIAATTALGNELRSPENEAGSRTNNPPQSRPTNPSPTTADILADKLVEWGVSVVFGLPGDKIGYILDAIRRRQDKIQFVLVHHEEGAAFMASGYAKFTGKLGVCISTAGPGAVHLLNGLWFCLCAARGSGSCTGGSLADHRSAGVSRGNDRQRGRCISAGCLLRFNERRMNRRALVS